MFALAKTDTLEGIASVADVIEFNCTAIDGNTLGSSEGLLGIGQTNIWSAILVTQIISLVLVNKHSSAVTINIQKDPSNLGTLYRVIAKDLTLGVGEMAIFTGDNIVISDGTSSVSVIGPLTDTELRASEVPVSLYGADGNEYKKDLTTGNFTVVENGHHEIHSGNHFYLSGNTTLGIGGTLYVKLVTPDNAKWGHFVWDIQSSGILTMILDEDATGGMAGGARPTIHANNRNEKCWTGRDDGAGNSATLLTDTTKAWTSDELIGYQVFNTVDGSSAIITDNDATTVTVAALVGGTDNDFDIGDEYEINSCGFVITSGVTACTDKIQRIDDSNFGSKGSGGTLGRDDEIIMKQNTVYCRGFTSGTASNIINFKASWYEHESV